MIRKLPLIISTLFPKPNQNTTRILQSKSFGNSAKWLCFVFIFMVNFSYGQIAQRGTATVSETLTTSLIINKPIGVIPGDVMIVNIAQQGLDDAGNTNTLANPTASGWTLVAGSNLLGGQDRWATVFYKIAGSSEPLNYTFTLNARIAGAIGSIVAFSGVDISGSSPFDVTPSSITVAGSETTNVTATGITTVSNNAAVIMFGQASNSSPTWNGWTTTSPGSLTEIYDNQIMASTAGKASIGAAWAIKATPGNTGNGNATLSSGQRNGGLLVALRPKPTVTPTNSKGTYTFCIDNGTTYTTTNANAGEYALVNVIKGYTYNFSVNNAFSGFNEYLTILDASTNASVAPVAYSSGTSGATINSWVSSISGQIKVVLSTYSSANNGTVGSSGITVTQTAIGNTQDDQTTGGNNVWRGHIYNWTGGAPPGGTSPNSPSNTDPFSNAQYAGYYDVGTEIFPIFNFGGTGSCFNVFSDGVQRANIYTEQFAVRYRMNSTSAVRPAGCYLITVQGDDGVRLYVDGVKVLDQWNQQSTTTYSSILVYLSGNSNLILDYYENAGTNEVSFNITPFNSNSNTVVTPTNSTVCSGNAPALLNGSTYTYNGSTVNPTIKFQWQTATSETGPWVNVTGGTGATAEDYTPAAITTSGVVTNYYRRIVSAVASNASACTWDSNVVRITTSAGSLTPGTPTSIHGNNITCSSFTANWSPVTNATNYLLDVSTNSGFTAGNFILNNVNIGLVTSYNITTGLTAGTTYFYRVRANNGCNNTTSASSENQTVTIVNPTVTISGTNVVCQGSISPNITFTNPLSNAITVTYNINGGTNATVNIASFGSTTLAAPTGSSGTFVYNLVSAAYQSAPSCSTSITGSANITVNATPVITPNRINESCSLLNDGSITPSLSGGLTNIRHIRLTQKFVNSDAWQQVAEISAFEIFTGNNVALSSNGATANASSVYTGDNISETFRAIDGDFTTRWHSNSTNVNENITVSLASPKNIDYLRIYNRADCCWSRGQNMLLELLDNANNVVYSKTVNLWENVNASHYIDVNILDVSWADATATLNRTGLDSGTYTLNYSDAVGCSVSSVISVSATNQSPSTPLIGTITNISCAVNTGSIELTGLPSGNWTINQTGTAASSYIGTTSDRTITGLASGTYTFTVTNADGCSSIATSPISIINQSSTEWNGTSWSNGSPDATKNAIILSVTPNSPFTANITACALTINPSVIATVPSGITLTIINAVTTNGQLIFENNSSLVQDPATTVNINTGNIIYKRTSAAMKNFDFSYWSSLVSGQTLFNLSPNTLSDKYFSYTGTAWKQEVASTTAMKPGIGYIIRTPKAGRWGNGENVVFPYSQPVQFVGVPNNGDISGQTVVSGNFYLIGNPYPSALNANEFLFNNTNNHGILNGTIYFWTHNTAIQQSGSKSIYLSDDYASLNGTGGVVARSGGQRPSGLIAAGQSFFGSAKASGTIQFKNNMRVAGNNTQFFKPAATSKTEASERHRLWLNMTNSGGAFKQMLIGYVTGATNDFEGDFDGVSFDGNSFIDFYSVNNTKKLTIQGRALPFEESDNVIVGYRSTIAGDFTISIDEADGLLTSQKVYLEDKQTNTIHDLTAQDYTFTTAKGTFNDRFVVKYTNKTLGTGDFETVNDGVEVVTKNKIITINSEKQNINKVLVYDITGKQLYQKDKVADVSLMIQNLRSAEQVLVIKVVLENEAVVTRKIIFN